MNQEPGMLASQPARGEGMPRAWEAMEHAETDGGAGGSGLFSGRPSVLLVEGDSLPGEGLADCFRSNGYCVTTMKQPLEVLEKYDSGDHTFDLLVCEGSRNNLTLAALMQARHPAPKILFVNGHQSAIPFRLYRESGCGFLRRSFTREELLDAASGILEH
ncbi:MAG: hypothetical protein AAB229_04100 [Candidatus Hydrogenedentota bacterium]